jgi:DNA-binding SARP family transcriptional activator
VSGEIGSPNSDPTILDAEALDLAVLGPPLVRWGARALTFRTRKEFALLVYLALTRTPQPREHLAAFLWPDRDAAAARNLLRTTLSRIRQHLAAAGSTSVEATTLLRSERDALGREVVGLVRDGTPSLRVDVELLEAAASWKGESAAASESEALLHAAAEAYRGAFLEGVQFDDAAELDEWVGVQRAYWQGQVERVLGRLILQQLERRAVVDATATARRWIGLNSLSEPAYRGLMRALASAGDRAGALAVYEQCRFVLRAELDLDPSPETVALAERLRRLPTSSVPHPVPTDKGPPSPAVGAWPFPRDVDFPFVGREREFAALVAAYQAARAGQVRVVVIEGEAGIGKTRLAEEFLRWATLEGADVLRGRGYEARGKLPYQPLVDALRPRLERENAPEDLVADVWLTELVRLFPELHERYPDLPPPATLAGDEAAGQGRLFEAVLQLILALAERAKPAALVLFYDDVQWSDLATRDILLYRLRRQREAGSPHLILLTVGTETLATVPELESWLGTLPRQVPTTRLALGPLAQVETEQAIAALLPHPSAAGGEIEPQLAPWLYAQTEGQPFYLVETLRALLDRGILVPRDSASGADRLPRLAIAAGVDRLLHLVPGTVRELIRGQLGGLSPRAQELLAATAVLGAEATFERLCQVAELDERAGLAALDELRHRRLVVENGGDPALQEGETIGPATFRFPHDLLREVVYTEAGDTRRRIFHRRTFALLESTTTSPAALAHHALGAGLIEPAFRYSVAAGDAALAVFAARDALAHYERARRLLTDPNARPSPVTADQWAQLHVQLGRAYEWVGHGSRPGPPMRRCASTPARPAPRSWREGSSPAWRSSPGGIRATWSRPARLRMRRSKCRKRAKTAICSPRRTGSPPFSATSQANPSSHERTRGAPRSWRRRRGVVSSSPAASWFKGTVRSSRATGARASTHSGEAARYMPSWRKSRQRNPPRADGARRPPRRFLSVDGAYGRDRPHCWRGELRGRGEPRHDLSGRAVPWPRARAQGSPPRAGQRERGGRDPRPVDSHDGARRGRQLRGGAPGRAARDPARPGDRRAELTVACGDVLGLRAAGHPRPRGGRAGRGRGVGTLREARDGILGPPSPGTALC